MACLQRFLSTSSCSSKGLLSCCRVCVLQRINQSLLTCHSHARKVTSTAISTHLPSTSNYACLKRPNWRGDHMLQRQYSQSPWVWPLGKIDRPHKKDMKEPTTSALVQLDDLSPHSLKELERLHDASSHSEVLDILHVGGSDLTEVHFGRALCRLADIHVEEKKENAERGLVRLSTALVLYDSKFGELCRVILQYSRHMDNKLFLDVLDALHKLNVPLKSSMTYTFLAQAEQRLNTFSAQELAQFAGVLNRHNQNDSRVSALKSAVALLTPRHIGNLTTLTHVLLLINTVGVDLENVPRGKLANMLLVILATKEERSLEDIVRAILALHKMNYRLDVLLELACPVLTQRMKELSNMDLHRVLCAVGGLKYPDGDFFEAASETVLESSGEWRVKWLIDAAEAFSAVKIQAPLLLDSVIRRVMECSLENLALADFTKLMTSMAEFKHRPPSSWNFQDFATRAANTLVSDRSTLSADNCRTILSLAHSSASLGIFPKELLDVVASRKFANWVMMVKDRREYRRVTRDIGSLLLLLRDSADQANYSVWTEKIQKLIPMQ